MIKYFSSQRRAAPACPEPHQHRRPPEPKPFIFVFKTEGEILKPAPGQVLKGSTNSEEACSCSSHPSCFRREASGRASSGCSLAGVQGFRADVLDSPPHCRAKPAPARGPRGFPPIFLPSWFNTSPLALQVGTQSTSWPDQPQQSIGDHTDIEFISAFIWFGFFSFRVIYTNFLVDFY